MSGDDQLNRMKTAAYNEIIRTTAIVARLRESDSGTADYAQQELTRASQEYQKGNYYISWEHAKKAYSLATGSSPAEEDSALDNLWKSESGNEPADDTHEDDFQETAEGLSSGDMPEETAPGQQPVSHDQPVSKDDGFDQHMPKPLDAASESMSGRTHCKNCKSRITPVPKFFGGYKCPLCGADVEGY